jgi:hypothetical protein
MDQRGCRHGSRRTGFRRVADSVPFAAERTEVNGSPSGDWSSGEASNLSKARVDCQNGSQADFRLPSPTIATISGNEYTEADNEAQR